MKYLSRKLFTVLLSVAVVLSAGIGLTACDNACKDGHNFVLTSTTATCTEGGTELYTCTNCNETKSEAVAAYGHNYNKNVCERCGDTVNNLSQFPEANRFEIAEKLSLIAPYTVDSETWVTSTRLLKLAKDDITTCTTNVQKAQTAYDNACNQATVRRYNAATGQWEWVVDEKAVATYKTALTNAENSLKQAQTDLEIYKVSYQFNCEGYAWYIAILGIKAEDVSNYAVNNNLTYLMALEKTALNTTSNPAWYNDIVSSIKTITGIDIKTGA